MQTLPGRDAQGCWGLTNTTSRVHSTWRFDKRGSRSGPDRSDMILITKRGTPPEQLVHDATCTRCKTEYEFTRD